MLLRPRCSVVSVYMKGDVYISWMWSWLNKRYFGLMPELNVVLLRHQLSCFQGLMIIVSIVNR